MILDEKGKEQFRDRVLQLVPREIERTNFLYLLDQIDQRDITIEKLLKNFLALISLSKDKGINVIQYEEMLSEIQVSKLVNIKEKD
jgi:chromatin segregation and condensation protein Rec8/ScpA/Scc1 (kleisin family)